MTTAEALSWFAVSVVAIVLLPWLLTELTARLGLWMPRANAAEDFAEECLAELGNVRPVVIDFEGGVVMVGPVASDG